MGTLRAVIASRIYAPEPAAASFRLQALARAIAHDGGEVLVLTSTVPPAMQSSETRKVGTRTEQYGGDAQRNNRRADQDDSRIRIRRSRVLRNSDGYLRGYIPYMSFDIPLFFRLLGIAKPDVVICEPPPTTGFVTRIASSIRRIPYVYYAADIWSDAASNTAPDFVVAALRSVENWVLSGASQIIAATPAVGDRLREMGHSRITVAPNGIDTDVFTMSGPTPDIDAPYLVYAGTASEWHGAEIFAQAMKLVLKEVPQALLVFLGQGSAWPEIEWIGQGLPEGTLIQMGRLRPAEAAMWQRGAAAALASVKPGAGYDFAIPTKAYSGLAVGKPVIYTGPGPLRSVIASEDLGTVVDYTVEDVAQAMIQALEETIESNSTAHASDEQPQSDSGAAHPSVNLTERAQRLSGWISRHHSLVKTGALALEGVYRALEIYRRKK